VLAVPVAETLGHQRLDLAPQEVVGAITEHGQRLVVGGNDAPLGVDHDRGVGHERQERAQEVDRRGLTTRLRRANRCC